MSFVDRYLPYFRQQLIPCPLLALLPFQPLFTENLHGDQLLAPPTFSSVLSATPTPLLCVSFQFLIYCSVFCCFIFCGVGGVVSLPRGLCWFIPGLAG
jgi:hypothetical protein